MGQIDVNCPSCGGEIPVEDVNLDRLVGKCRGCNTVFSFAAKVSTPAPINAAYGAHGALGTLGGKRAEVDMPKNLQIDKSGKSIKMSIKWFDYSTMSSKHIPK